MLMSGAFFKKIELDKKLKVSLSLGADKFMLMIIIFFS